MSNSPGDTARTVLLTRARDENERIAPLFEDAGLHTISLPGIELAEPDDWSAADEAIARLEEFDGVFFTSKSAVRSFLRRLDAVREDGREILRKTTLAAVGEKTEQVLEAEALTVSITPEIGSAEHLLASLGELQLEGKQFLFPKSSIARDLIPLALRDAGASVEEIVVYRNVAPKQEALDSIRAGLLDGSIDAVAFFSPSAVRNIVQMLGIRCLENALCCAIGPTTAASLTAAGVKRIIRAEQPTTESVIGTITDHFTRSAST